MNYAMQISASGALTSMYRQDVLTNNLANVNTVGFKPYTPVARQRDHVRAEDGLWHLPSNELLEALGAGTHLAENRISFRQGPVEQTGNPLDLAVHGDGFLTVGDMQDGQPVVRLTRDGRMTLNSSGTLVMSTTGQPVLAVGGNPVRIDPGAGPVQIDAAGRVTQNNEAVAQLGFADVGDRQRLTKLGDSLFALDGAQPLLPAGGRLVQGAVEGSAVNEIDAIMGVTNAASAAQRNLEMIQRFDQLMDRAINGLGRVG